MKLSEEIKLKNSKKGKYKLTEKDLEVLDKKYIDRRIIGKEMSYLKKFRKNKEKRKLSYGHMLGENKFLRVKLIGIKNKIDHILRVSEHSR